MNHEILDEPLPDSGGLAKKTTHPAVTYNVIDETFNVALSDECSAEVYGKGRFAYAVRMAEHATEISRLTAENAQLFSLLSDIFFDLEKRRVKARSLNPELDHRVWMRIKHLLEGGDHAERFFWHVRTNFPTDRQAAKYYDVSPSFLSQVLSGKKRPTKAMLSDIALAATTATKAGDQ